MLYTENSLRLRVLKVICVCVHVCAWSNVSQEIRTAWPEKKSNCLTHLAMK